MVVESQRCLEGEQCVLGALTSASASIQQAANSQPWLHAQHLGVTGRAGTKGGCIHSKTPAGAQVLRNEREEGKPGRPASLKEAKFPTPRPRRHTQEGTLWHWLSNSTTHSGPGRNSAGTERAQGLHSAGGHSSPAPLHTLPPSSLGSGVGARGWGLSLSAFPLWPVFILKLTS